MKEITVCDYKGRDNEPCYGEIDSFMTTEGLWVTFCEGHKIVPMGGPYVPKDPIRRWIFSQQNQRIRTLQAENDRLWEMVRYADTKLQRLDAGEIEIPAARLEILASLYD